MEKSLQSLYFLQCLILLLAVSGASAQPLPGIDNILNRQNDQVERKVTEQVEEQVTGQVENQVTGQVVNQVEAVQMRTQERARESTRSRALEQVNRQVENQAMGQIERIGQQAEQVLDELPEPAQTATERARDVLDEEPGQQAVDVLGQQLPGRLPIADEAGNEAFVEVDIGDNIRVIEYEWVMLVNEEQRPRLETEATELMQFLSDSRELSGSGNQLLTFSVPPDLDNNEAILGLVPEDMQDLIDRNHVYMVQSKPVDEALLSRLQSPQTAVCKAPVTVGVIDSAIAGQHPAFSHLEEGRHIRSQNFFTSDIPQPRGHGTSIAGLLVGQGEELEPLLPEATLFSAAVVYSQDGEHQGATLMHLLEALDWMMQQDSVQVVNMSLAGPANRLLEKSVALAAEQGVYVVAAVGNEGPHAAPRFPAAYPQVISATAVNRLAEIYYWSIHGDYVDFAARGESVITARGDGSFGAESGTSIAAPVIAAFLACALHEHFGLEAALSTLKAEAVDLGEPGHDPVFGHGLLLP